MPEKAMPIIVFKIRYFPKHDTYFFGFCKIWNFSPFKICFINKDPFFKKQAVYQRLNCLTMKKVTIIDDGNYHPLNSYIDNQDRIEWEDSPRWKFSIAILELGGGSFMVPFAMGSPSLIYIIFSIVFVYFCSGYLFTFYLSLLIVLLGFFSPDFYLELKRRNTKYAYTKSKLLFQTWSWGKRKVFILDLSEIKKVTCDYQSDHSGVIYFMPKMELGFVTHDFDAGNRRHYPTFEDIPNALGVSRQLEQYRKERVMEKTKEKVLSYKNN